MFKSKWNAYRYQDLDLHHVHPERTRGNKKNANHKRPYKRRGDYDQQFTEKSMKYRLSLLKLYVYEEGHTRWCNDKPHAKSKLHGRLPESYWKLWIPYPTRDAWRSSYAYHITPTWKRGQKLYNYERMRWFKAHQRLRNKWIDDKSLVVVEHLCREDTKNHTGKAIANECCTQRVVESKSLNARNPSTDACGRRSIARWKAHGK